MEGWQRNHIRSNLDKLLENTTSRNRLIVVLSELNVLCPGDVDAINAEIGEYNKTNELYKIVQTRTNGYKYLIQALHKTNQTGAVDLLLKGHPECSSLLEGKIKFLGKVLSLEHVLEEEDFDSIFADLNSTITYDSYINIFLTNQGTDDEPLQIINDTIPAELPYYISRSLSKRTKINPQLFEQCCPDVFVFKDIPRDKLTKLAQNNKTDISGNQIINVTSRFILLELDQDWLNIRQNSKRPVILIQYEEVDNPYTLLETWGCSKIIGHFLEHSKDGSTDLQEEDLIGVAQRSEASGFCICDLPGIGKSSLLANLARTISKLHPDRIVAFIPLPDIIKNIVPLLDSNNMPVDAMQVVLDYITPTLLARGLVLKLMKRQSIRLELFFDGFDEVGFDKMNLTKTFLKDIINSNTTKVYVASRSHARHELESTLGSISYDILPFDVTNQQSFLVQFWSKQDSSCHVTKLETFASHCLRNYTRFLTAGERDIVGIPLQCRLIAEVYVEKACRYSRPGEDVPLEDAYTPIYSMYDIYEEFMDMNFKKVLHLQQEQNYSTANPNQATRAHSSFQQMQNFHVMKAIRLLFPELVDEFVGILNVDMEESEERQRRCFDLGTIEEIHNRNTYSTKFIHRTFAEFLVAEYVGTMLDNDMILPTKLMEILYQHILLTVQAEQFNVTNFAKSGSYVRRVDLYSFRYFQVVFFLNYNIQKRASLQYTFCRDVDALQKFDKIIGSRALYKLILGCIRHNLFNIFSLTKECKMALKPVSFFGRLYVKVEKYLWYFSDPSLSNEQGIFNIFVTACKFSSEKILDEFAGLLLDYYNYDAKQICVFAKKRDMKTPLHDAVENQNYQILESLVKLLPVEQGEELIHCCVRNSNECDEAGLETRRNMVGLLLRINPQLIEDKNSLSATPLLESFCHFELIKYLVDKGANIFAQDNRGKTVVDKAAFWMSADEYHGLVEFILKGNSNKNASDLFVKRNRMGERGLLNAGEGGARLHKCMRGDTLEMILDKCEVEINAKDSDGNNVLFHGIKGQCGLDIAKVLIRRGIDIHAKNNEGKNVMDVAAGMGNEVMVTYFASFGCCTHQDYVAVNIDN